MAKEFQRALYATTGTNINAILSILVRLYELLGFEKAVLFATWRSRRFVEEAKQRLEEYIASSVEVEVDEDLMSKLFGPGADVHDVIVKLQQRLKRECRSGEVVVDITSGTKLMSSVLMLAAEASQGACGDRLWVSYILSHGAEVGWAWWSSKLSKDAGHYPRVPRLFEIPIAYRVAGHQPESLACTCTSVERLRMPSRVRIPLYVKGGKLEPLTTALSDTTWLFNAITCSEARVYLGVGGTEITLFRVNGWGSEKLEITHELENVDQRRRVCENLIPATRDKRENLIKLCMDSLFGLVSASGLWRLVVDRASKGCDRFGLKKDVLLSDLVAGILSGTIKARLLLDTNLAYHGVHNDIIEALYMVALLDPRAVQDQLTQRIAMLPCARREALDRFTDDVKLEPRGAHPKAVQDSLAAMVAEWLMEEKSVDTGAKCETQMLMHADENTILATILATHDKGAYETWEAATESCVVLLKLEPAWLTSPRYKLLGEDLHGEKRQKTLHERLTTHIHGLRLNAAVAQLVALLTAVLSKSTRLVVRGECRKVEIVKRDPKYATVSIIAK